jgi:hypothetical protein
MCRMSAVTASKVPKLDRHESGISGCHDHAVRSGPCMHVLHRATCACQAAGGGRARTEASVRMAGCIAAAHGASPAAPHGASSGAGRATSVESVTSSSHVAQSTSCESCEWSVPASARSALSEAPAATCTAAVSAMTAPAPCVPHEWPCEWTHAEAACASSALDVLCPACSGAVVMCSTRSPAEPSATAIAAVRVAMIGQVRRKGPSV